MFVEILEPEELWDKEINALREIRKIYCTMIEILLYSLNFKYSTVHVPLAVHEPCYITVRGNLK